MEAADGCLYFYHHLLRVFPSCDAAARWHCLSVKTRPLFLPKYLSSVLVCHATSSLAASYLSLFHWFSAVWLDVPWCGFLCICPVYDFLGFSDLCIYSFHQIRRLFGHDFFIIVSADLPFLGHKPHMFQNRVCVPQALRDCSALVPSVLQLRKSSQSHLLFSFFVSVLSEASPFHMLPLKISN